MAWFKRDKADDAPAEDIQAEAPAERRGWFSRLRDGLAKSSSKLGDGIAGLFGGGRRRLDAATLEELEDILIMGDLGPSTAAKIVAGLARRRFDDELDGAEIRAELATEIAAMLNPVAVPLAIDPAKKPHVVLVVGVNGSGKTTTIGKLAKSHRDAGLDVSLAAGDTFRAAAIEQLQIWGERTGCHVTARQLGADASGLAYDALAEARKRGDDMLLIDTAGRLQNKTELMAELAKIVRVLRKVDPSAPHDVILVLDATVGQNALSQVEAFTRIAGITGLVMTKLDGTAKGGILVAVAAKFALPVHFIGVGESVDDLSAFDPGDFARALVGLGNRT
jgi:fused signal recognition particle receptor